MDKKERTVPKSTPRIIISKVPAEVLPFTFTKEEKEAGLDKKHLQALLGLELLVTGDATREDKAFSVSVLAKDGLIYRLDKDGKKTTARWFKEALDALIGERNLKLAESRLPPHIEEASVVHEGLAPAPLESSPEIAEALLPPHMEEVAEVSGEPVPSVMESAPEVVETFDPNLIMVTFDARVCDFRP